MAGTEHPEPESGEHDHAAEAGEVGEAEVEAAVNAFLDAQMGPEPTDKAETVDADWVPEDTGAAEWAERVKETQYGLG